MLVLILAQLLVREGLDRSANGHRRKRPNRGDLAS
jgi:hypothetical protein